jgi:hypothetical protein
MTVPVSSHPSAVITSRQSELILECARQLGFMLSGGRGNLAWRERLKTYGVTRLEDLTQAQAADLLETLRWFLRKRSEG